VKKVSLSLVLFGTVVGAVLCAPAVNAGPLEQAKRMHDRLAGVPANAATLDQMTQMIASGNTSAAAEIAMAHPDFYRTTLKLFAAPATNRDLDLFEPLNDYTATVIGLVRDDVDFRELLQTNVLYVGADGLGLPPYQANNNAHYAALERQAVDLKTHLVRRSQNTLNGIPDDASAGVMTSRAAAKAFFYLGTNRAMLRFTLMSQLCTDLEPLKDISRPVDKIRQDVSRSPGGDSRIFNNRCVGCHAGLDPLAQAFAYYDYKFTDADGSNGSVFYQASGTTNATTGSRVQPKYHFNAGSFPYGFKTADDQWENYWRQGPNAALGWDTSLPGKGQGAKSLGQELAGSTAFAQCQVKKVFKTVCLREPESATDVLQVNQLTRQFRAGGYKLKPVFAETAAYCMGN
jgi:hypothetical protein